MEHNTITSSTMDSNTNTKKKIFKKIKKPIGTTNKMFRLMHFNTMDTKTDNSIKSDDPNNKKPIKIEKSHFRIQMFGINQNGETCAIFIDDMKPFFYIGVGNDWNDETAVLFSKDIRKRLGKFSEKYLISVKLINRKKLYDFTGKDSFQFLELMFENMTVFHKAKSLWYTESNNDNEMESKNFKGSQKYSGYVFNQTNLTLYETKIPPLLRYFHISNISPSGWIEIDNAATQIETLTTTCDYEYICSMHHINPLISKEDPVPYKIACFDIEASSSHGDFPVPIKNYKRLASQIVDAYTYRVQTGDIKPNDHQKINMFLKKAILSAFGINGSSQNIDIVYPKQKASKEHIKTTIEKLLIEPILNLQQDAQYTEGKEQLKITKMFDKIVDDAKTLLKKDQNTDEGEEDDTIEERGIIGGFGSGVGESTTHITPSYSNNNIKIANNETVINVLCSDVFTREKIIGL